MEWSIGEFCLFRTAHASMHVRDRELPKQDGIRNQPANLAHTLRCTPDNKGEKKPSVGWIEFDGLYIGMSGPGFAETAAVTADDRLLYK
jgi:hypothetical protein